MLQHDTACKVLDGLGVNACKEHQRSSAIAVLARVRRGNTLCSICGHSFNSTQSPRTHIQGQHMDASHLKCKKCHFSGFTPGHMNQKARSSNVIGMAVMGPTTPKATSMSIGRHIPRADHHHAHTVAKTFLGSMVSNAIF